jgi:hypothetical protein
MKRERDVAGGVSYVKEDVENVFVIRAARTRSTIQVTDEVSSTHLLMTAQRPKRHCRLYLSVFHAHFLACAHRVPMMYSTRAQIIIWRQYVIGH